MVKITRTNNAEVERQLLAQKEKKSGTYRLEIVIEQLEKDFYNKCYLCEQKAPTSINVEHFVPHRGKNRDLEFDWNNLFYVCQHCNHTKSDKVEYDEILNCTNPEHEVTNWIKLELKPYPKEKVLIFAQTEDNKVLNLVENTISLLIEVYNKDNTPIKARETENLRLLIQQELRLFANLLTNYAYEELEDEEKQDILNKIKKHLHNSSPFCAFKRWIIKENEYLSLLFIQYFH